MRDRLRDAAQRGELSFLDPETGLPYTPTVRRDDYDLIATAKLNAWFEANNRTYRLRGVEEAVRIASEDPNSMGPPKVMATFAVRADVAANRKF